MTVLLSLRLITRQFNQNVCCMRRFILILVFGLLLMYSYAERPLKFTENYKGEKMWNTQRMVPYGGSVSLEINDTIACIKYPSSEKVDTFIYQDKFNNGFRYTRLKSRYRQEYIIISRDSVKLQIGEPMEVNYFYKSRGN